MIKLFTADQPAYRIGNQRGAEQRQDHRAVRGHFHHDDHRCQRRAHHPGEIADHADQHDRTRRRARKDQCDQLSDPRTDRQRGRKDPTRRARQCGGQRGNELCRAETERRTATRQQLPRGGITGAPADPVAEPAGQRDNRPAQHGKHDRPRAQRGKQAVIRLPHRDQRAGKQSAGRTAEHACHRHHQQHRMQRQAAGHRAEIDIVAHQPQADETRDHHRDHHQHRDFLFERGGQFLDGKGDPGQRGVERRGNPCRAAGNDHARGHRHAQPAVDRGHQRGADLHGRAFAADRTADQQHDHGAHDLGKGHRQRQQSLGLDRAGHLACRDDLGDARTARRRKTGAGDPHHRAEHQRGKHYRRQRCYAEQPVELRLGHLAGAGKGDGDQPQRDRARKRGQARTCDIQRIAPARPADRHRPITTAAAQGRATGRPARQGSSRANTT